MKKKFKLFLILAVFVKFIVAASQEELNNNPIDDLLFKAVLEKNIYEALFAIKLGANVNQVNEIPHRWIPNSKYIRPILHMAVKQNDLPMVELLLDNNADISVSEYALLKIAWKSNNIDILKTLVNDGLELDLDYDDSWDICFEGNLEIFKFLHPNADDVHNDLIFAAVATNNKPMLDYLLSFGLDINHPDYVDGSNVLYQAAATCDIDFFKWLHSQNLDINTLAENKYNPLSSAINAKNIKVIKYLLNLEIPLTYEKIEDIYNLFDEYSQDMHEIIETMLKLYSKQLKDIFLLHGFVKNIKTSPEDFKIYLNLLLKNDFDINGVNAEGQHPIELTQNTGKIDTLIKADADYNFERNNIHPLLLLHSQQYFTNTKNLNFFLKLPKIKISNNDIALIQNTPNTEKRNEIISLLQKIKRANDRQNELFTAIASGNITTVKNLICAATPNERICLYSFDQESENNSLHHAIIWDKLNIVKLILQAAPDLVDIPNKKGKTPMDLLPSRRAILTALLSNKLARKAVKTDNNSDNTKIRALA